MTGERKRRSLADTLRAVSPIAGDSLQGAAQTMRLISSKGSAPAPAVEPPKPEEQKVLEAVRKGEQTEQTPEQTEQTFSEQTEQTEQTVGVCAEQTEQTEQTHHKKTEQTNRAETPEQTEQTSGTNPLLELAPSRLVFLEHLLRNRARYDREFVAWAQIVKDTGLSLITLRRLAKDLTDKGIIRTEFDHLRRKGSRIYLVEEYARALSGILKGGGRLYEQTSTDHAPEQTEQTNSKYHEQTEQTERTEQTAPRKDGRIREIHPSNGGLAERLLSLDDDQVKFYWPHLAGADFGVDQLRRIIESLETLGKPLDQLIEGLDRADFEFRQRQGSLLDGQGQTIRQPMGYVFNSLARTGRYRRPEGYVSPEEQAELDKAEDARRIIAARKERLELEFQAWVSGLTAAERADIKRKYPPSPEDQVLKAEWRKRQEEPQEGAGSRLDAGEGKESVEANKKP